MGKINITKIFHFEAAHALKEYDGPCANIHGHSYRMEVSIGLKDVEEVSHHNLNTPTASPKQGMVMDFSDLKKCVNQHIIDTFDHSLILNQDCDPTLIAELKKHYQNIIILPFQPTSENLLCEFAERIRQHLPEKVQLKKIRLYETENSFAEWEE